MQSPYDNPGWAGRVSPLAPQSVSFTAQGAPPAQPPPPIGTNRSEILAYLLKQPRGPAPLSTGQAIVEGLGKGLEGWAVGNKLDQEKRQKIEHGRMMAEFLGVPPGDPRFEPMATFLSTGAWSPPGELIADRFGLNKDKPPPAPIIQTFFDEKSGRQYKAQWNAATNDWDRIGGMEAPPATDNPPPYTDAAQVEADYQNGFLTLEQRDAELLSLAPEGEPMFPGTSTEAIGLNYLVENDILTPQQAAELATAKQITDPATGAIFLALPSGIFRQASPGQPAIPVPIPGAGTSPPPQAAPGAAQQPQVVPGNMLPAPSSPVGTDIFAPPPAMPDGQQAPQLPSPQPGQPGTRPGMIQLTDPNPAAPMSPATQTAILKAEENILAGEQVVASMERALQLNDIAMSGPGAETQGYFTSLWGDEAGVATEELKNIVATQALSQLKLIFGSMPTEGERKILLEIQGSVTQAKEVRRGIYQRALEAANRRLELNRQRIEGLRSGTYFEPDFGLAGTDGADVDVSDDPLQEIMQQAQEAIEAGANPEAVRERLRERGVDDSFLGQ